MRIRVWPQFWFGELRGGVSMGPRGLCRCSSHGHQPPRPPCFWSRLQTSCLHHLEHARDPPSNLPWLISLPCTSCQRGTVETSYLSPFSWSVSSWCWKWFSVPLISLYKSFHQIFRPPCQPRLWWLGAGAQTTFLLPTPLWVKTSRRQWSL